MSGDKTAVTAHLDENECRRLQQFEKQNGHGNPSNAARKAINRGLRDWELGNDPAQSWMLNAGIAAGLWSILSVYGTVVMNFPSFEISAFSVYMAFIFLLAHAVQLARTKLNGRLSFGSGVKQ